MPSASCWRTFSLSHIRTCSTTVARRAAGLRLKTDPHPAVRIVGSLVTLGRDGIGKDKKRRALPALRAEPFDQQAVFVVEHQPEPFARNVARRLAVDRVAEIHVVGRDRFRDRARRAAGLEKNARHFLAGADFGERPVFAARRD